MRCSGRNPLLLVVAVALPACLPIEDGNEDDCWDSSDAPTARDGSTITVGGQALRQDGSPLSGHVLLEDPPTLEDIFGAVFTLGLTCLNEDLSGIDCTEYEQLELDAAGRFEYALLEADTTGTLGFDKTFLLFVGLPAGADGLPRPTLVAGASFRKQHVELPVLQLWEPRLELLDEAGVVRVLFEEPPELACTTRQEIEITFRDAEGRSFWAQPAGDVDRRILEDAHGDVQASVRIENDAWYGSVTTLHLNSGAVAFAGAAGPPPSRGAACALDGEEHATDCPLTDGAVVITEGLGGPATLDLGETAAIDAVVLRGSFSSLTVSVSTDEDSWTDLATALQGDSVLVTPASASARYVRLQERPDEYGQQNALQIAEVSVW
jgi:hypothetical protein